MPTDPITTETLAEGKRLLEAANVATANHLRYGSRWEESVVAIDAWRNWLHAKGTRLIAAAKERDRLRSDLEAIRDGDGNGAWCRAYAIQALTPGEEAV